MTRNEARNHIKENPDIFLELDNFSANRYTRTPSYICPICKSGTGKNGTGIKQCKNDPYHFTCWSGNCFECKDIIDIIGLKYGLDSYNTKLRKACEIYGIDYTKLDYEGTAGTFTSGNKSTPPISRQSSHHKEPMESDYIKFFRKCHDNIDKCDYLTHRGISRQIQDFYFVGYQWFRNHWKLIIPTSQFSYYCRDTRPDNEIPEKELAWKKFKKGKVHLFNVKQAYKSDKPIFIVEGEIDAMSVIELGYQAIGLGSTSEIDIFVDYLKEHPISQTLLISLDNDESGANASALLANNLDELGVSYKVVNISGSYKDPNEHLVADRIGFIQAVQSALVK